MSRKIQEDLIFPKIFHCDICNTESAYFVIVKPFGQVVWNGTVCAHADRSRIGKKIELVEVKNFLNAEKQEAEEFCAQVMGDTRTDILQYISTINAALQRIRAH